jgi:uncharacterized protein (TIGR02453 family)
MIALVLPAEPGDPVAFSGWPAEAIEFYEGLEADNTKTYWTAHKHVYDQAVHAPMVALLEELEDEFGEGKLFRPYRDVRFSADKSPYKTNIAATLAVGGYIHLSAKGLGLGNGMYQMASDQLDRYRRAVADDGSGERLCSVIAEVERHEIDVAGHSSLKTAPRGYAKDHPRAGLLRHKGLVAWQEWPTGAWLGTPAVKQRVTAFLHATAPLMSWLDEHVGDTELAAER